MKIMKLVDDFLNKITMYRLTLYCVVFLWILALLLSIFGVLHYNPVNLILSLVLIFGICVLTNEVFARTFKAPSNVESVYITAFILASIISPIGSLADFYFIFWSSVLAIAAKYILAVRKKHIFNPAAIGVVLAALITGQAATWWMGTLWMAPFVLVSGLLVSRKIKRVDLFLSFLISSLFFMIGYGIFNGQTLWLIFIGAIINSPVLYLGSIMLTEPMTTPPDRKLRIVYGFLVGLLNAPFVNLAGFYTTPEIALVLGNIFSYAVSSKDKLILKLENKIKIAENTFDFIFSPDKKLRYEPGQYLEWTLAHEKIDNRGMRRYFTIASSPTEKNIIMGVKFYEKPSSYKQSLLSLEKDSIVVASQLAGDFTLPKNKNQKLVFIAGGIGITPFRSMIKYLIDRNQKRDIVIFYSNKTFNDIAYKEIFDEAEQKLGIKTIYCLSDQSSLPLNWNGEKGFISQEMMEKYVSDFKKRTFYISGPRSMVSAFLETLKNSGLSKNQIKTDYFPGFA